MMTPRARASAFCDHFGLRLPVLMGPMAGSSPPALAAAVAAAGGLGACGALLMDRAAITDWVGAFRARSNGAFQINTWVPSPVPPVEAAAVERIRSLLAERGVELGPVDATGLPDFAEQCAAIVDARPHVASSIMGLYPPEVVTAFKRQGTAWFANVTSLAEAEAAEAAGADAVVVSGIEAGGHRGSFEPAAAERQGGTLFALLPIIADAVSIPVVAAGGIADGRGLAAALALGASAVQVGTALLRTPEAGTAPAWSDAIAQALPEGTVLTRAFSGRLARAVRNEWTEAVGEDALPYPVQRQATAHLRARAVQQGDGSAMQMWAGQAARLSRAEPAADVVRRLWDEAEGLLT